MPCVSALFRQQICTTRSDFPGEFVVSQLLWKIMGHMQKTIYYSDTLQLYTHELSICIILM